MWKKLKILTKKCRKRSIYSAQQKFLSKIKWFKKIKPELFNINQQILSLARISMISRILVWPATWPRCTEVIHTFVTLKIMMANSPYWRELCQRRHILSRNNKTQDPLLLNSLKMNIRCLFNQENSKRQTSSMNKCRSRFCQCLKMLCIYALQTVAYTRK